MKGGAARRREWWRIKRRGRCLQDIVVLFAVSLGCLQHASFGGALPHLVLHVELGRALTRVDSLAVDEKAKRGHVHALPLRIR